jgi:hypothetical protein
VGLVVEAGLEGRASLLMSLRIGVSTTLKLIIETITMVKKTPNPKRKDKGCGMVRNRSEFGTTKISCHR